MSDSKKESKKRKKYFYKNATKKVRGNVLQPGMKGFLVTCNHQEKMCIREAYNILNEYADKLYKNEADATEFDSLSNLAPDKAFEDELCALQKSGKSGMHRFQQVNTKTKNCLFIETQIDEPGHLVHSIMKDVKTSHKQISRHLLRILPVSLTCKGHIESIEKAGEVLLDNFLQSSESKNLDLPVTFTVVVKVRNNNSVTKSDIIRIFLNLVEGKCINWLPQLKNSALVICIEVVQTVCCLSIIKDYYRFKKYNLIEVAKSEETNVTEKGADVDKFVSEGDINTDATLSVKDKESEVQDEGLVNETVPGSKICEGSNDEKGSINAVQ